MTLGNGAYIGNNRYRIERVLGQGGFGITYMGYQDSLKRKVAIKEFFVSNICFRKDTTYEVVSKSSMEELIKKLKNQFVKEARLIAALSNKHVVKIYDVFEENGTAYYVMEYHEGNSLEDLVKADGALDPEGALEYVRQVAEALREVHSNKILHLDVKPSNIMVSKYGEAVLIDFGVSKHYDNKGNQTSLSLVGVSEGYASAEMYDEGPAQFFDPRLDVYSLAATLYFLLTATPPPHAKVIEKNGLDYPKSVPQVFVNAINKVLLGTPKSRPATVEEFMSLLPYKGRGASLLEIVQKMFVGKYKYFAYTVLVLLLSLCIYIIVPPLPPSLEEAYNAALEKLNSTNKQEAHSGLVEMEKLAGKNYPKAMHEMALTYGWYPSDSASLSRKLTLGFLYYDTQDGKRKNYPLNPEHNRMAREMYERILLLDDADENLGLKANAAYRLAAYSLLLDEKKEADYEKGLEYLLLGKNYAMRAGDKGLLPKIENGLIEVRKKIKGKKTK
ncbi:MAG: serine/threonine protein kinase [Bacteroidaceae bacterium]|nr:serine/threonine protein kinase [Bacteroidaceae bacterium]